MKKPETVLDLFQCEFDIMSVRRRQRFWLLQFHFLFAAYENALTGLCAKDLSAADLTLVSLSKLTHMFTSFFKEARRRLFFQLHRLAAACHGPIATPRYDNLRSALRTNVSLTDLVCHLLIPPLVD